MMAYHSSGTIGNLLHSNLAGYQYLAHRQWACRRSRLVGKEITNNVIAIHTIIQRFFSNANENSFAQLANNWSDTLPYAHRDRDLHTKLRRSTAYLLLYKSAIPIVCLRASTQPRKALLASGSEGTWEWHTKQQSSNPRSAHKVAMKPLIVCGKSARICSP